MKKTLEEKLQMCKEHVDEGKSISHVCELHGTVDKDDKYIDVVKDMYEDNVLDDDDIEDLGLSKEKDDFER